MHIYTKVPFITNVVAIRIENGSITKWNWHDVIDFEDIKYRENLKLVFHLLHKWEKKNISLNNNIDDIMYCFICMLHASSWKRFAQCLAICVMHFNWKKKKKKKNVVLRMIHFTNESRWKKCKFWTQSKIEYDWIECFATTIIIWLLSNDWQSGA